MELRKLMETYKEMFGSGYPSIQLGIDEKMIQKCIDTKTPAEDLYKDKLKSNVLY